MSGLSTTAQGIVAELLFTVLLILGSDGQLEVSRPVTDDERRDIETHIRGLFLQGLIFQVKSTTYFEHRFKARHLEIHFDVEKDRLLSHPLYWYLFAYLDVEAMGLAEPLFLVPSDEVHRYATPKLTEKGWSFNFNASLEPDAKDHWHKFQLSKRELATRVLAIIQSQKPSTTPMLAGPEQHLPPGAILVRHVAFPSGES